MLFYHQFTWNQTLYGKVFRMRPMTICTLAPMFNFGDRPRNLRYGKYSMLVSIPMLVKYANLTSVRSLSYDRLVIKMKGDDSAAAQADLVEAIKAKLSKSTANNL